MCLLDYVEAATRRHCMCQSHEWDMSKPYLRGGHGGIFAGEAYMSRLPRRLCGSPFIWARARLQGFLGLVHHHVFPAFVGVTGGRIFRKNRVVTTIVLAVSEVTLYFTWTAGLQIGGSNSMEAVAAGGETEQESSPAEMTPCVYPSVRGMSGPDRRGGA